VSWFVVDDVVDHVDAELPKPQKKFNEISLMYLHVLTTVVIIFEKSHYNGYLEGGGGGGSAANGLGR
jgi:hypothetical protein